MAFWHKCLLIPIFFLQVSEAQSILMFEDQTESGFKLVVNNFLQNETALPKLNLQHFPQSELQVSILLQNGLEIKRRLPKLSEGIHKYVLYRDYRGNIRLRYRGIYKELSQSALIFDYSETNPWTPKPNEELAFLADTVSNYSDWQKERLGEEQNIAELIAQKDSLNNKMVEKKDSSSKVVLLSAPDPVKVKDPGESVAMEQKDTSKTLSKLETGLVHESSGQASPQKEGKDPYQVFSDTFFNMSFEFDKVVMAKDFGREHKLDENQLIEILKHLKFDQSRLDLLKSLLPHQQHLYPFESQILSCLDYDLSKQEAKKYFP